MDRSSSVRRIPASRSTTTVTDGRNNIRTLTYTDKSQLVNETFGAGSALSQTATYTRNTAGLIASVTDHRSRRKEWMYAPKEVPLGDDTNGNITQITYLAGTANAFTEKFTYTTDYNKVKTYTDPRNKITTMNYAPKEVPLGDDAKGNVTQVKDPLNNVTNMTYDSQGKVLTMTSGSAGNTITRTYTYDVNDVRTVTEAGFTSTSTFTTDNLGRVTAMTDGRGNVGYYEYDNRSRLTKATDPNGKITQLQYDGNGNITKVTDAANAITQYAYDPRNRLTSITDPFNVVEQWTWDNKGNLATYKDRRNKTTTFSYDALDRLSGTIYADATSTTFGYSYPAGGFAEMTMTEGTKVITRRFDNRDRLSYEVTPKGRIDYAYDAADRRSSMTVQGQTALTYAWDDADRLSTITQGARNIALAYDQANRRSKITFPGALEQRMTYSKAWGRPSAISYFAGATQIDALTDATFDGDGRPISRTGAAAANGIPNAVNQLPTAFTASYTSNRLTTFNGQAWTYDTQGNLTGDGINTYVWDARNRLMQTKQGATVTASFEYDALNRRTKKIIGAASTEYLHDGLTPVQEKRVGDITQLITGPGIDDYLSRITTTIGATPTTTTRNYLTDFLGSATALADDAGAIKTTYGYEPYGEATSAGEATVNSFQYTGRENDETGLMYYRARYYSPKAKRFISEDPIGQNAGPNVYGYVGGNPLSYIDPEGLAACLVTFPDMPIDTGMGFTSTSLGGHGGVLTFDSSGGTQYHEFGRYPTSQAIGAGLPPDDGNIRQVSVPDLKMDKNSQPTTKSMDALKRALGQKAGKGTSATLTCDANANENKIRDYIKKLADDAKRPKYSWKPWSSNQCRDFANRAFNAGK